MVFYLSVPTPGISGQAFEDRGLKGRGSCQVQQSGTFVIPLTAPNMSHAIMTLNLHEFYSVGEANGFIAGAAFKNCFRPLKGAPLQPPVVMIDVKGKGDIDELKDLGFSQEMSVKMPGKFAVGSGITVDALRSLWSLDYNLNGQTFMGNTNGFGLLSFYYAWHAVRIFQTVIGARKYDETRVEFVVDDKMSMTTVDDGYRKIGSYDRKPAKEVLDGGMGTSNVIGAEYLQPVASYLDEKRDNLVDGVYEMSSKHETGASGHIFGYFDGMLIANNNYVADIFFRYFSRCLSDTADDFKILVPQLRSGFRSLAGTSAGLILQHVYFGLQSSMETGCKLQVIIDNGKYQGFALIGNCGVLQDGVVHGPDSVDDFHQGMTSLDDHAYYVGKIVEKLTGMKLKGSGITAPVDAELLKRSSRALAREVYKRDFSDSADKDEVMAYIENLKYGSEYVVVSEASVTSLVNDLRGGNEPSDDVPFYLGAGEFAFSDNMFVRILSQFGPKAPTISIRTGTQTHMIPNVEVEKFENAYPFMPVYLRSLNDSAEMWAEVIRTRKIKTAAAKKKGAGKVFDRSQDKLHIGGRSGLALYKVIKDWAYSTAGGKRKVDFDPDAVIRDAEELAKRKKVMKRTGQLF